MRYLKQTLFILWIGAILSSLLFTQPSSIYSSGGSPSSLLEKAKTCQSTLLRSNKVMKYRHQWEKCITLYQKFIRSPKEHASKEEAMFHLAELYLGLSKFSGKAQDLKMAEQMAGELRMKYPASHFVRAIEDQLSQNQLRTPPPRTPSSTVWLNTVRYWSYPDYTRVVFDLSKEATYKQQKHSNPESLWITLYNARLGQDLDQKIITIKDGILTQVRVVQETPTTVRAILDLGQVADHRIIHFSDPDRLVVDIFGQESQPPPEMQKPPSREISRIIIDPGHGGKDPGAIGRKGLTEKEVVLDISLRLKDLLKKNLDKEVWMTRDRDIYIPLEERTQLANGKQADLFISVHANAAPSRKARGVELYTLGQASDPAALATAARENSIQEGSLKNLEGVIGLMLADLSIMKRFDQSLEFADTTRQAFLRTLGARYDVVDLGVKQAPFYVLMNANMPSILAEVSFISNPIEERRLASRAYRGKIAQSLFEGIREYLINSSQGLRVQSLRTLE